MLRGKPFKAYLIGPKRSQNFLKEDIDTGRRHEKFEFYSMGITVLLN